MFTGIIESIGRIESSETIGGDKRLRISSEDIDWSIVKVGDSIAVNGVCLTAIVIDQNAFSADVSLETLAKTSLGQLGSSSPVNLETALTLNARLGGHLVSGHVDGLANLVEMETDARSTRYRFEVDVDLQRYIAAKGSVTLDGVSLTVNQVVDNRFDVNIVPHTQEKTLFQFYQPGDRVNIEVDIIARYLERLLMGSTDNRIERDQQFMRTLIESGFIADDQRS